MEEMKGGGVCDSAEMDVVMWWWWLRVVSVVLFLVVTDL
jgi:hypothetical protein